MKLRVSARERAHIMNYLKLCYILIILCALYVLKVVVYPEKIDEIIIMPYQIYLMIECIFHATAITIVGNVLAIRFL